MHKRPPKTREMMYAQLPEKELYNLETALTKMEKYTDPIFENLENFPSKDVKQLQKLQL